MRLLTATVTLIVVSALWLNDVAHARGNWQLGKWDPGVHNVKNAVFWAFCGHRYRYCGDGWEAWRVAGCESHWNVWARNGQYLGILQMGSSERARYGHGWNPWTQAVAAHRYFTAAGGWGPWTCRWAA